MDLDSLLQIDIFKAFERECRKSHSRYWFKPYLEAVFLLAVDLKRRGILKKAARMLAKSRGLRFDRRASPVKVLIDASCRADYKTRSRWSRAVQYALDYRDGWGPAKSLSPLFDRFGGVSGCASRIAKPRPTPREKKKREGLRDWR
jgi:hypothetical protein